jgi:hypothetical protein
MVVEEGRLMVGAEPYLEQKMLLIWPSCNFPQDPTFFSQHHDILNFFKQNIYHKFLGKAFCIKERKKESSSSQSCCILNLPMRGSALFAPYTSVSESS